MKTRLRHLWLALTCLPGLLFQSRQRRLLAEMRRLCRQLPDIMKQPIPQAMAELAPDAQGQRPSLPPETTTRRLADLAALLERHSSLGLCLRRSLIRYHYLRQLNVPVVVLFGARFVQEHDRKNVAGHAWLALNGRPYHEDEENYRGFTVMLRWPQESPQNKN